MKKILMTFAVLLILATAILINSLFREKEEKSEEIETTSVNLTATPEVVPTLGIKNTDFTEGVLIKKYPDNMACFKLETPDGFQIVCDPYNINEKLQPDVVVESHQDLDHRDTSELEQPYELITKPGEYEIGDAVIRGYIGKHNQGDDEGTNTIFVFELNDITIAHFASQGEVPKEEVLSGIGPVDVLLIQAFQNPNYGKLVFKDVETITNQLSPKIIIPEHGDSNASQQLAKQLHTSEQVEKSGSIVITRSILDEIDTTLVINLDNSFTH